MKKIFIFLCFFVIAQLLMSQRSPVFMSNDRLFYEGKVMFDDGNYAGCIDKIREYKKISKDEDLLQEADFLLVSSDYRQGRKDAGQNLKDYLDDYPETRHSDEVCFMIGSTHFSNEDYQVAIFWFNRADIDNLSLKDQEDYTYRMAYSCLKTDKRDEARLLFTSLKDNNSSYKDAATYYLAYLHYLNKDYTAALPLFNSLKENQNFKSEVLYYLAQINFIQGRYTQSIKEGLALLSDYPSHENNLEINRIVGVSYYNESDYTNAAKYLKVYVDGTERPLRNDLYLLGLSYYNLKNYQSAIPYLSRSITANDELGQNAFLYLGQSYLKVNDNKNALMAFEAASREDFDPHIKEAAMYNYAVLLHKTSTSPFGESVTVLENFLNTYPKSQYSDRINDCLVEVYLTTKNYDTALKSIDKIKNPGKKILEAKQKIYYHLGTVYFSNTEFTQSVDYFTKAIGAGDYAPAEKEKAIYWRAESYYRQEKYSSAIKDYKSFLQTAERNNDLVGMAYYNLGYSYFKEQQYSNAQTAFSDYINRETDKTKMTYADAYARMGDCYYHNRQFSSAMDAYTQSASLQPSMADYTIFQKGFVLGLQKDYKGKVAQMDKLISAYPDSRYVTDALYEKGRAYVMMDNSASAIQVYESLLSKYPESSNARKAGIQIGLLYFNINQPQKAADAYKKVIEKYPGSDEARVAVQDLKSVYMELNDVGGYAKYVNSLGGVAKFEASEQDSLTYLSAERLFMRGETKQAQAALKSYLQTFPDGAFNSNAHYYLGNVYLQNKETANAKSEFQKVLDAGDNKFVEDALRHLAAIQYDSQEYEAAFASYQRLQNKSEKKDNKIEAFLGVMRTAAHLDKYMDMLNASNALLKESKLEPEVSAEATYYRSQAYWGLKERAKALPDLKELAKDTRTVYGAEAKYLIAQYYYDNKEPDKAEAEVMDYTKKGTPHAYWLARAFVLLSDIYADKKDYLQARQYLESLQHNYKNENDDIHSMISERLTKLANK